MLLKLQGTIGVIIGTGPRGTIGTGVSASVSYRNNRGYNIIGTRVI